MTRCCVFITWLVSTILVSTTTRRICMYALFTMGAILITLVTINLLEWIHLELIRWYYVYPLQFGIKKKSFFKIL